MTRCNRPPCRGLVDETGFCDTCGRRPVQIGPTTAKGGPGPSSRRPASADLSLPVFEFPDPSSLIQANPEVPERSRKCGNCGAPVGRSHAGQPALSEGYCQQCKHWFSFLPSLRDGDLVAGQYQVIGCFARGGLGWIYLAHDTHLHDRLVVLKGLIDTGDAVIAAEERDVLTMMDHPNIVRILNFVAHPDVRTGQSREYIVMEYVDGLVLSEVERQSREGGTPLGEPLRAEHVIACGLQILAAFEYLHSRERVYADMKPENVIVRPGQHGGQQANRIKLIDLGAVRSFGARRNIIGTDGYQVGQAEIEARGLTVASDIHTLGRTLGRLADAIQDRPDRIAIGLESFHRSLARAVHEDPERRFATAAEMAQQLQGVQREIASLRDGIARPAPSTVFMPAATLLDAGLGTVPPLDRWTGNPRRKPGGVLADGRPTAAAVAVGLPQPRVDPADPAASLLAAAGAPDQRRLLDKLADAEHDSAELQLARCRAHLELAELDPAQDCLVRADHLLGAAAGYDWRLRWHRGLLALGHGDITTAERAFDAVYDALPGEAAPKLALAYCAEHHGDLPLAEQLYGAIWQGDRSLVSAAFGLARLRLSHGDRGGAVAALDAVPRESRHHENAAIASVIVLCGRLGSGPPTSADLHNAAARLPALYLDGGAGSGEARDRMTALVREAGIQSVRGQPVALPVRDRAAVSRNPDELALRRSLEESYRALARQARNADAHGVLIDLANAIRPKTLV